MIRSNSIVGSGPSVVRKFILTDGGSFTLPVGVLVLHSEIIVDKDDNEVLEVWLSVPMSQSASSGPQAAEPSGHTIYTNTTIHEDPQDFAPITIQEPEEDEYYYD